MGSKLMELGKNLYMARKRKSSSHLALVGTWVFVHRDRHGNIKDYEVVHNLIPNEGQNYLLGAAIHGDTQITVWYFAPHVSSGYTPALTHTYASPGYTEAVAQYQELNRQPWGPDAPANESITNSTAAIITAAQNAVSFYGAGLVGGGTSADGKGDTAGGGTLLSTSNLGSAKTLDTDETLSMTYTINTSSS